MAKYFGKLIRPSTIGALMDGVYRIVKLNFLFNLTILPWIILNIYITFVPETLWLYILTSLFLYPAIKTLFCGIESTISFKRYLWIWKKSFFKEVRRGLLYSFLFLLLIINIFIVISQDQFIYYTPIFLSLSMYSSVAILHLLGMNESGLSWKDQLRSCLFRSFRYFTHTIIIFLLFFTLLSLYYFFPYLNFLFTSAMILAIVHYISDKSLKMSSRKVIK